MRPGLAKAWRPVSAGLYALLLAAIPAAAAAQAVGIDKRNRTVTAQMRALPVLVGGRVSARPLGKPMPAGATAYSHQWPGVYFEGAFTGERVVVKLDDPVNEYRLLIDGAAPIALDRLGKAEVTVSGLGVGPHRIRLEKVTESIAARATFAGFYVPAIQEALGAPARIRQIEFVGPSGTAGYGNRSTERTCDLEQVRASTDTQQAYPALIAKHFDADYQINAISGRGLVRNIDGVMPDHSFSAVYPYIFLDRTEPYRDLAWQPQVVELVLVADFMGSLRQGERWTRLDDLVADYLGAYAAFLADLRRRAPGAAVVVQWFDESQIPEGPDRALAERLRAGIGEAARAAGTRRIEFMVPAGLVLENTGCNHHANLADHRKVADAYIRWIEARPGLWEGK